PYPTLFRSLGPVEGGGGAGRGASGGGVGGDRDQGIGPGAVSRPADLVGPGYFVRRPGAGGGVCLGRMERFRHRVVESGASTLRKSPARRHRWADQPVGTSRRPDPPLSDADAGDGERHPPVAGYRRCGSAGDGSAYRGDGGRVYRPGSASPPAVAEAERAEFLMRLPEGAFSPVAFSLPEGVCKEERPGRVSW